MYPPQVSRLIHSAYTRLTLIGRERHVLQFNDDKRSCNNNAAARRTAAAAGVCAFLHKFFSLFGVLAVD